MYVWWLKSLLIPNLKLTTNGEFHHLIKNLNIVFGKTNNKKKKKRKKKRKGK